MQKFLVLFLAPAAGLEAWMQLPESERKGDEEKMQEAWNVWMQNHKELFAGPVGGAGKTKRITSAGVEDTKNDVMLYAIAQGASHEAVAEAFKDHPHFGIPNASIEIMPISYLPE